MNTVSRLMVKILSIMIFILAVVLSLFGYSPNFTEDVVSACVL